MDNIALNYYMSSQYNNFWKRVPPSGRLLEKLPAGEKCGGSYKIFFLVILVIFLNFFTFRILVGPENVYKYDILNYKIIDIPGHNCCAGWGFSHLTLFFFLGWLYPDCGWTVLGAGVLWEVLESTLFKYFNGNNPIIRRTANEKVQYIDWWTGSIYDIFFNTLGFFIGRELAKSRGKLVIPGLN